LYDAAPGRGWGAPAPSVAAVPALPAVDEPRPRRAVGLGVAALMALVAGLVAAAVTGGLILAFDTETAATSTSEGTTTPTTGPGGQLDIQALLAKVQPSVVSIRTGEEGGREVYGGAGSGVIISEEGLVLTNAHVIAGFNEMQVTLFDGEVLTAELVGSLPDDDIALIRLLDPDEELVPAELGSSADVQVGDRVVAIGNALNLSGPPSVTEGIVSAKDRTIPVPNSVLRNLIQTDAAINPGNSGGPLLNGAGEVVGINTAIIDDAQNIGFAIAIDEIKPVIEDLREGRGEITPDTAFLGVSTMAVSDVNASVLDEYGVLTEEGAFVTEVVPDSAAEAAGLRPGDVIVSIGGETIEGPEDVGERITSSEPGDELDIELERDGDVIETTVTLKSRADTGD
jgi:putative serine protease PepD